ncbi:hypothetical protein [Chryseobacterium gregarium]|uniref:hypothetical protein n=1 Tax=Chryseobacterium gregarium TaxID=456299 RepID=UPI00041F95D0|nr:hypothetical protein [Chryseobacterium gregarium]
MNSKIKIALALLGTGTLIWGLRNRKKNKVKTFTAPDGNTYKENQVYRTVDNKTYKNGKEVRFGKPIPEHNNSSVNAYNNSAENLSKNYQSVNKDVNYHQKGVRHH